MNNEMNGCPLVTMISVFYNRGYCVNESVQSMIDQTYPNLEIILVDDESVDNTLEKLQNFESDPRVKVITHKNMGFTKSIKKAVEKIANGEFIAIHGSGDISYPERIDSQVRAILKDENIAVCATANNNIKAADSTVLDNHIFAAKVIEKKHFYFAVPFTHGAAMFSKEKYSLIGGYDERFKLCQDWDLWLRFIDVGLDIAYIPDLLYSRYERERSVSNSSDMNGFMHIEAITKIHQKAQDRDEVLDSLINVHVSKVDPETIKRFRKARSFQVIRLYLSDLENDYNRAVHALKDYGGMALLPYFLMTLMRFLVCLGMKKENILSFIRSIKSKKSFK